MMQVIKSPTTGKIKLHKMNWREYVELCSVCDMLSEQLLSSGKPQTLIVGYVIQRVNKRLSRSIHYPLHDTHFKRATISISFEADEILALWAYYPTSDHLTIRHILNLNIPKYF